MKDEDEPILLPPTQITLNMAQATQQMTVENDAQPRILLKRVCFEQ